MREVSVLKGLGYLTSTLSVLLLGIVSLKAAEESPLLLACLLLGMTTSVAGMCLRWRSHRLEQHEKDRERESPAALPASPLRPFPDRN
ncbi:hypothetical protein [Sphingomonas sp. Root241]|uniref:hypothetical protein n=1 Tax=Sphingomonas sp. Root241 TaxID=1736501 RepID=UPI0007012032|nr:hypothetical protein [Sphingomonas sp. Root241]KRC82323.1 hypothetical protein ASE13_08500 [Sphingomonas sp. Root241]